MMRGVVTRKAELIIPIRVAGPLGVVDVDAMIDTGFTSWLSLPPTLVAALGLPFETRGSATLANDAVAEFDVSTGRVEWAGTWRDVSVYSLGKTPLIGIGLLAGWRLSADVELGGVVEIRPIR